MDLEGSPELDQRGLSGRMSPRRSRLRALSCVTTTVAVILSVAGTSVLGGCQTGPGGEEAGDAKTQPRQAKGDAAGASVAVAKVAMEPFELAVPGTSVTLEMQPISPDAGAPFYVSATEATWDLYDAFIFNLDTDAGESTEASDAVTRPSKPYVLADRGYGHAGYALLSASPAAVERFVEWLSIKTGRNIRVPTEAEMRYLLESSGIADADARIASGWFEENAEYSTHAVGSKPVDANGLHDTWGNLSEYAVAPDGTWVVMGGSFIDPVADVGLDYRIPFTTDWNADDPQIPKSPWWLASNDWVGVRLVCEP